MTLDFGSSFIYDKFGPNFSAAIKSDTVSYSNVGRNVVSNDHTGLYMDNLLQLVFRKTVVGD